jgi:hypothetical protein
MLSRQARPAFHHVCLKFALPSETDYEIAGESIRVASAFIRRVEAENKTTNIQELREKVYAALGLEDFRVINIPPVEPRRITPSLPKPVPISEAELNEKVQRRMAAMLNSRAIIPPRP